jgi:pSer/pThr/pTyr-binding forkhead associated (FHA) protein
MQSTITLTITTGKLSEKQYIFDSRTTYLIGRNDHCYLSIPDKFNQRVSRYHCLLDINPPEIRIRDLGSLNGTYINNTKIGGRQSHQNAEEAGKLNFPEDVLENDPVPILQRNSNIPKKLAQVIDLALIEKPQIYFDRADSEAWR